LSLTFYNVLLLFVICKLRLWVGRLSSYLELCYIDSQNCRSQVKCLRHFSIFVKVKGAANFVLRVEALTECSFKNVDL